MRWRHLGNGAHQPEGENQPHELTLDDLWILVAGAVDDQQAKAAQDDERKQQRGIEVDPP